MIVGSLIFMVAGFVFLMLGRGSDPNVYQFLSIVASLIAGTLLIMGYIKERKRRPAQTGQDAFSKRPAIEVSSPEANTPDVEADLKALEEGLDEEEPETLSPEPLVTSMRVRKDMRRNAADETSKGTPVLQPAMAGTASGSMPAGEHSVPGAAPRGETSSATSTGHGTGPEPPSESGDASGQGALPSPGSSGAPPAANQQWAQLIADVDTEKFEPPAFEKSKSKTKSDRQDSQTKADPGKGNEEMTQSAATASNTEEGPQPQKTRRGLFGLFKRKTVEAPAAPASAEPEEARAISRPAPPEPAGAGMEAGPEAASPQAGADELTEARDEAAREIGKEPEGQGPVSRPETTPFGEQIEAVASNAGGRRPPVKAKTPPKRKTGGNKGISAAKPRATAKPKTAVKTRAGAAKPKAAGGSKTAAKPKASAPAGTKTSKSARTPKTAATAAKPKSSAKRKP